MRLPSDRASSQPRVGIMRSDGRIGELAPSLPDQGLPPHQNATLFGQITLWLPRFRCTDCSGLEAGHSCPAHCRSTPELDQLRAQFSACMPYRVAAGVLEHLLSIHIRLDHRRQVVVNLQLVEGEQGARRRAEVAPAGRATEPRRPIGPWTGPAGRTAAVRAHRRPLGPGQRIVQNIAQASSSSIRRICFKLTVRAAAARRKCCDMGDLRLRRPPESTVIMPLRKHNVHYMFLFARDLPKRGNATSAHPIIHSDLVAACQHRPFPLPSGITSDN